MTGLSPHPMMTGDTERRHAEEVIDTTLSLLKNRRHLVRAETPSHAGTSRRFRFQTAVTRTLQGSLLPADQRRALMAHANELGMRPFEATLMIAMAQDRARNQLPPLHADPFLRDEEERPVRRSRRLRARSIARASTAVCTGVFLASTLIVLFSL